MYILYAYAYYRYVCIYKITKMLNFINKRKIKRIIKREELNLKNIKLKIVNEKIIWKIIIWKKININC